MDQSLKEKTIGKPRILVAPLDWGLGHATRCVPIIRELLAKDCDVWLAGEGAQEHLLKTEFPQLPFLQLDGYRIRYSRSAIGLLLGMFRQTHKIFRAIRKEHAWLLSMVNEYNFDAVIADNRYGLYHKKIPCIFITHQLSIKSPLGKWTERILQKRNYKFISRFNACWIPDKEKENNLAGELSHPEKKPPVPVQYVGLLSRFHKKEAEEIKGHLLIVLSGPEPQRSILENKIVNEISHYNGSATIVRGLPASSSIIPSTNMIRFYNHLPADELNNEMLKAGYVISRSGYSSIMDMVTLQKKSILIPTPGQTEQEYLGKYLMKRGIAYGVKQENFSLTDALNAASDYSYNIPAIYNNNSLRNIIAGFLHQVDKPALG
ncbi:MAG: glycosyl transferase family 28 [Sphingobacteriales bacterium]|nr:glycosyl transferase family 28 [Sphingobacteriales bacterium]